MDFFYTIAEIKGYVPELDAETPLLSLERSFTIARSKVVEIIGKDVYELLRLDKIKLPEVSKALKSALANFMLYEHIVFSEAGKVKEKKMFKYEYEQVRAKYVDYGYSYLDVVITELDNNDVKEWQESAQKQAISKLFITSTDFCELGGIDNRYFFFRIRNVIRDVTDDEIYPRYTPEKITNMDDRGVRLLKRATVYFTLARVIQEYDYLELPRPLRSSLQSEYSGNNGLDKEDLKRISDSYRSRALDLLDRLEVKNRIHPEDNSPLTEDDKFYLIS